MSSMLNMCLSKNDRVAGIRLLVSATIEGVWGRTCNLTVCVCVPAVLLESLAGVDLLVLLRPVCVCVCWGVMC